jgi:CBS domain-containing protein
LVAATGVGAVGLSGGESCVPRVGDLPIRAVPIIPAHLSMAAARKIAELKRATVLFVERDGRLMGTLDEHDLLEAPDDAAVADCLRSIELCLGPTTTAERARELFARSRTTALPVAAGAFLLGAVCRADVERALRSRRAHKSRERFSSVRATA